MPEIIIIGGTDSSGGAGLTRDTAAAHSIGCEVLPVVTAVTVQTNGALIATELMPEEVVRLQIKAAFDSGEPCSVKIGMLGSASIASVVVEALADHQLPVVIDPVFKSSSNGCLMRGSLPDQLLQRATIITPNLPEAATLSNLPQAATPLEIRRQAEAILALGPQAVLVKDGHGDAPIVSDRLFQASGHDVFCHKRLSFGRRGTGCHLATAIACHLTMQRDLTNACELAIAQVHKWLRKVQEN
ncbi:bifunctional hydroxymethylpyrimidine kinase/phosphomethylpyrimidine kinase [Algicella marina]|uniref:hydroxymethylpyrimidine kinase n=1 Tax=Algicella marina TaxID=2683284 RepID=A0A6P1SZB0_9RHOB|nr:hydroxymethylpyrimidine/phosphomethylpyrimidine kinase [Algicella marina]QHQ36024.1 hydroxymethylpyrimidine/phosphomethylpyrimidine kinase [Algicella marina]